MATFNLYLNKTYAIILPEKLEVLESEIGDYRQLIAEISDNNLDEIFDHNLFINSTDILSVIRNNPERYANDIITIVSSDLFNIYLNHTELLNNNEIIDLRKNLSSERPIFENIIEDNQIRTPIYRLTNSINSLNVLHIKVAEFLRFLNNNKPVLIRMKNTKLFVSLSYERYDFYDLGEEKIDRSRVVF